MSIWISVADNTASNLSLSDTTDLIYAQESRQAAAITFNTSQAIIATCELLETYALERDSKLINVSLNKLDAYVDASCYPSQNWNAAALAMLEALRSLLRTNQNTAALNLIKIIFTFAYRKEIFAPASDSHALLTYLSKLADLRFLARSNESAKVLAATDFAPLALPILNLAKALAPQLPQFAAQISLDEDALTEKSASSPAAQEDVAQGALETIEREYAALKTQGYTCNLASAQQAYLACQKLAALGRYQAQFYLGLAILLTYRASTPLPKPESEDLSVDSFTVGLTSCRLEKHLPPLGYCLELSKYLADKAASADLDIDQSDIFFFQLLRCALEIQGGQHAQMQDSWQKVAEFLADDAHSPADCASGSFQEDENKALRDLATNLQARLDQELQKLGQLAALLAPLKDSDSELLDAHSALGTLVNAKPDALISAPGIELMQAGKTLLDAGKLPLAADLLSLSLWRLGSAGAPNLNPDYPQNLALLGLTYAKSGKLDLAVSWFELAAQNFSFAAHLAAEDKVSGEVSYLRQSATSWRLAGINAAKSGKYRQAQQILTRAVDAYDDDARYKAETENLKVWLAAVNEKL